MLSFLFEVYSTLFWPLFVLGFLIGVADQYLDLGLLNVPTTADSIMDSCFVEVPHYMPRTKISHELVLLKPTTVLVHLPVLLPTPAFLERTERRLNVFVCALLDLLQSSETYTHAHTASVPTPSRFGSNLTPSSPYKSRPMVPRFPGSYSAYIPLGRN